MNGICDRPGCNQEAINVITMRIGDTREQFEMCSDHWSMTAIEVNGERMLQIEDRKPEQGGPSDA